MKSQRQYGILRLALLLALPLFTTLGGIAGGESQSTDSATAVDATSDPLARVCELGITYALSGEGASAESVFISLLSRAPGDARALNNLGNLHLWRGDTDLALAFYDRAGQADSTDAGILLNEATALMIGGEEEAARERAGEGIRQAGGPEEAARLLGLKYGDPDDAAARAADRAQVSKDEVLSLLRAATQAIPIDSTLTPNTSTGKANAKEQKPVPAWRPAGARGAAGTDVTAVVYWKR